MDEEANKQNEKPTQVVIVLASGQVVGPVPMVARDKDGVYVLVSLAMKLKSGKAVERNVARLVPYTSILFMDILPDEEENNDGGTTS